MNKNIALIGAGYWGKNHLRNLAELGVLHSVFDVNDEVLAERSNDYPEVDYVKDENKIVDDPEVQAVVIAAPAELHNRLTKKYLIAGKDVLVEKPLALKIREGEELIQVAKTNKRILMVGHVLQYHPAVLKLKELIDFGYIGEIRYGGYLLDSGTYYM